MRGGPGPLAFDAACVRLRAAVDSPDHNHYQNLSWSVMERNTLTFVLACERGNSLGALTSDRPKAAVPFGGEFRIIDFSLSNCLHSDLRQVYVATQYRSRSLHAHLRSAWGMFNAELGEFIESLPPQMKAGERWYGGGADVLLQNLDLLEQSDAEEILVVDGSHVYRMDYAALLAFHREQEADVTIAHCTRSPEDATGLDTLELDESQTILRYTAAREEPPASDQTRGASAEVPAQAAIGVFVFDRAGLVRMLRRINDLGQVVGAVGRDLIEPAIGELKLVGYGFGGKRGRVSQDRFFSAVNSIEAYFKANMALLEPVSPLDLYQRDWPIWCHPGRNPPARTVSSHKGNEGIFVNSIVSNGTVITGGAVTQSVLCPRVRVEDSATLERCILFEGVHVGEGAELKNCIIDKRARIPAGTRIGFDSRADAERFEVTRNGVVLVPMDYGRGPAAESAQSNIMGGAPGRDSAQSGVR
ncbi:MAG: glucose-1-phosphate adenylyltransferase [Gammaproteobacteria bacterium]|nr:glucose-1-phosphate adenylyltransferase [Gammaproteobacteria bacterium]